MIGVQNIEQVFAGVHMASQLRAASCQVFLPPLLLGLMTRIRATLWSNCMERIVLR